MKFNPFRPHNIIGPGIFCGRLEEIQAIDRALHQTRNGNPHHFLFEGERGIGKSSLMLVASASATEAQQAHTETNFNFVVIEVELLESTNYIEMIRKIAASFRSELRKRDHFRTRAKDVWDFVSKWNIFGLEFGRDDSDFSTADAVDDLARMFAKFLEEMGAEVDGLLILIDEADKPDPSAANLGEFAKILTEKLTKLNCNRVCIGLAGLPVLLQKLKQGHESSLRIFETMMLEPLSLRESEMVVQRGLAEANSKNSKPTTITDDALKAIVHLAEGYPHFIQQFAHCAFDQDSDDSIDLDDVVQGAYRENGAIAQLGRKYFQAMYFDKVSSGDYRKVLDVMADKLDQWISRQEIIRASGIKETQVTNALAALKSRNVILANEQKKGEYRLPTRSFAVWIKALNEKREQIGGSPQP